MKLILVLFLLSNSQLHADEKRAVLSFSEDEGFRLRKGVEERLGVQVFKIKSSGLLRIPKSAVIYSKDETQVFRKRGGYWKSIDIDPVWKNSAYELTSRQLIPGDEIALLRGELLKVVDMQLKAGEQTGHIH